MHTSAGICLGENCDVTVRSDMKKVWNRLVPQGNGLYEHDYEGPDDMPAHVKSILSGVSLNVPICDGKLALGTWQGRCSLMQVYGSWSIVHILIRGNWLLPFRVHDIKIYKTKTINFTFILSDVLFHSSKMIYNID